MNLIYRSILCLVLLVLCTSGSVRRVDFRRGIKNNVCKDLSGKVLVYYVFIDSKNTSPWTEYDIRSTIDSVEIALRWLKQQAEVNQMPLTIMSDYFIGNEFTTIRKNLEHGSVASTASTPNLRKGVESLNKWADGIASRIGKEVEISNKDGLPEIKNPRTKERLVAHLRDKHEVESVCLLFMVNNYFKNDISLAINQMGNNDVEFAIVSYKYPSVIAQNILTLFGAADLSKSLYRRNEKKIKLAEQFFPNDIMGDVYGKSLETVHLGEITKYLVGWENNLDPKYQPLLTDNFAGF